MNAKDCAKRYLEKGLSVIAVAPNGTKAPAREVGSWTKFQHERPQFAQLESWYPEGSLNGVAILGGAVSGKLTILDFDSAEAYIQWREDCAQEGLLFELDKLPIVQTPSGGRHVYCWGISAKCAKLAKNAGGKTLIETKAEGGYCLAPGCPPECHPLGLQYHWENEGWMAEGKQPEPIDPEIYDLFIVLARLQDEKINSVEERKEVALDAITPPYTDGRLRPGDDYNNRATWDEILEPLGWSVVRRRENVIHWRRPGKKIGVSATSGYCKGEKSGDRFCVFSTNAWPFQDGQTYSKFGAFALVHCGNDIRTAAKKLGENGYGTPDDEIVLLNMPNALPTRTLDAVNTSVATIATVPGTTQHAARINLLKTKYSFLVPNDDTGKPFKYVKDFDRSIPINDWYWYGYVKPGQTTLITALWKSGKTTLLSCLLRALETGGEFCGQNIKQARALYISEETDCSWVNRAETFFFNPEYHGWILKPAGTQDSFEAWEAFILLCKDIMEKHGFNILITDTLASLWPVKDENNAAEVGKAYRCFDYLVKGNPYSVVSIHHARKSGGTNFTSARGSGALSSSFDLLLDFERWEGIGAENTKNKRIIKANGRWHGITPDEKVIEFVDNQYYSLGHPDNLKSSQRKKNVIDSLDENEWMTTDEICSATQQRRTYVIEELKRLVAGGEAVQSLNKGTRGNPVKYRKVTMQTEQKDLLKGEVSHVIDGY